ncbi:MAG: hypothetical protein H0T91_05440 [Propionibacteriaceae bacterium]|nr:hypothetical protein [Propionibacteriaceae bacterium]
MDPWTLGLIAVIVAGLAVIVFGALSDRSKTKRAAAEMLAPPQRRIPQFRPDSPAPNYLSELQARRKPGDSQPTDLTAAEREEIAQLLTDASTVKINAGYASQDFVTDPSSSWAVLDAPRVLVCADKVESTRELLSILERLILSRTPLVVVAPSLADEVRGTLEVNAIQQTMALLAVTPTSSDLQVVAGATGAQIRARSDLQAGYVWPEHLGTCARWVSDAKHSFLIGPPASDSGSQ